MTAKQANRKAVASNRKPRNRGSRTRLARRWRRAAAVERLEERALLAAITVTNLAPSGAGSLAAAIETANDPSTHPGPDEIRFARGLRGTIEVDAELVITDDLTIRGPGAHRLTVSGDGATRVFNAISSDLTDPITVGIHRLAIADGLATDAPGFSAEFGFAFGGGLYNLGSDVSMTGVRFVDNRVDAPGVAAGGAIANEFGGSLTLRHARFVDNVATGVVIAAGGAITSDIGPTPNGEGTPGQPKMDITHSVFSGNRARAAINDPALAGDFAAFSGFAFGGAVANLAGDVSVSHSRFVDNAVFGGNGINGNDGGFANGGAIYTNDFSPFDVVGDVLGRDSSLDVTHSTFVGNSSTAGTGDAAAGGGVAAGGAISASLAFLPDSAHIRHSVFTGNTANGGAGGEGGAGGSAVGGALSVLAGADVAVAYSRFFGNAANGGAGTDGGDGTGGAIGLGRIVTAVPTPLEALVPSIVVRHTMLRGNSANGGLGIAGTGGNGNGGGLGVTAAANASVTRSLILHNRAVGGAGTQGGDGRGGGVFNLGSTTDLARTIIFRNAAEAGDGDDDGLGLGGGMFNGDDGDLVGTLSVDRFTYLLTRFNHADDEGDNVFGELS